MRTSKRKVFVLCEHHEYSGENVVIGLFPDREKAEQAIRAKGEVLCWKENFMPFALVWAQVLTTPEGRETLRSWCWIEVHELEETVKRPQFYREIIALVCCGFLIIAMHATRPPELLATIVVLLCCLGVLVALGSVILKA